MDQQTTRQPGTRRTVAAGLTAGLAIGGLVGWLLATVFEYLQWAAVARWTLHATVVMVALAVLAALATYIWRDEDPRDGSDPDVED